MCYLTNGKHFGFYLSFGTVMLLLFTTVPVVLVLGFAGAVARRSQLFPVRWLGLIYTSMVRGVPDIIFFLFALIAVDQGIEYLRHQYFCPDWPDAIRQGNDFVVCARAKMPLSASAEWVHKTYSFFQAVFAFAIVFGAFAANTIFGAMNAVPHAQLETAEAYGMTRNQVFRRILMPQMWVYALPGLSNLWMIFVKATPLLFLLGIQDIVYWARELGGTKTAVFAYPHPDWRLWYFLGLLVFYLFLTWISEKVFARLMVRLSHGQATLAGEAQRKAAA